jgi:hypothetical protein
MRFEHDPNPSDPDHALDAILVGEHLPRHGAPARSSDSASFSGLRDEGTRAMLPGPPPPVDSSKAEPGCEHPSLG